MLSFVFVLGQLRKKSEEPELPLVGEVQSSTVRQRLDILIRISLDAALNHDEVAQRLGNVFFALSQWNRAAVLWVHHDELCKVWHWDRMNQRVSCNSSSRHNQQRFLYHH